MSAECHAYPACVMERWKVICKAKGKEGGEPTSLETHLLPILGAHLA